MDQATTLFDRLGGIRATAKLVGRPPSTVQSWKSAGRIPASEQPELLSKARAAGHDITADDVVFPMGRPADEASDDAERDAA